MKTVAQLIEALRKYPDETLVFLWDKEPPKNRILDPYGVLDYPFSYPNGEPRRCVIAAYQYDTSDDEQEDEE